MTKRNLLLALPVKKWKVHSEIRAILGVYLKPKKEPNQNS